MLILDCYLVLRIENLNIYIKKDKRCFLKCQLICVYTVYGANKANIEFVAQCTLKIISSGDDHKIGNSKDLFSRDIS